MSPSGIEAAFCCGWLAAIGARARVLAVVGASFQNARFFLVIALHCFCRSDETEKYIVHFDFGLDGVNNNKSGSETSVSSSTPASAIIYDAYTSIVKKKIKINDVFEDLHRFFCLIIMSR